MAFAGLFVLVGVAVIAVGGLNLKKWWTMRGMDPAGASVAGSGLQELEGRARPVDGTVTAPFSDTESLICEYKVESHQHDHDDPGSDWHTREHGTEAVPFEVEHEGTVVAVDPEGAQRLLTRELRVDTGGAGDYPVGVQEYISAGGSVELGPVELNSRGGRLRFTEKRLEPGEEVYVLGPAEQNTSASPDGSDARLAIAPGDRGWKKWILGDPFIVSDSGEGQAERRQLKRALMLALFGSIFAGIGLAVILFPSAFT